MSDFAIYTPKMGVSERVPKILLSEVYLANESRNVHEKLGLYSKIRGRIPLIYDAEGNKIRTPKYYWAVTAVNTTGKVLAVAGQQKTTIEANYGEVQRIRINGSTGNDNRYTVDAVVENDFTDTITLVVQGAKQFTISGNHAAEFADHQFIVVSGSTGNDGWYTLVSATDDGPDTQLIVSESIPDGTADGTIGMGTEVTVLETVPDGTADGNLFVGQTPVICLHEYERQATAISYLLVGTAYHVWLWDDTNYILIPLFTSGTPTSVTRMEMITHLDAVYMTNNVDKIQVAYLGTSISNVFGTAVNASGLPIGGGVYITKARHLFSYESYLFAGYLTYSTAAVYPQRAHWGSRGTGSSAANPADFDATGSGDTGYKDFAKDESFLRGFAVKGNDLIVAKEERIVRGWLTTEDTVFEWVEEYLKVGTCSADTLVNDTAGKLYFLASDFTIREIDTPDPVAALAEETLQSLNPEAVEYAQAAYMRDLEQIWFSLPTQNAETNNLIVAYHPRTGNLFFHDLAIRCFGTYKRAVKFTYDRLPYRTYEEWGAAWLIYDTKVNRLGYLMNVAADYNGESFEMNGGTKDDGETYLGKLVLSTTLTPEGKNPYYFKRIGRGMALYFNRGTDGDGKNLISGGDFETLEHWTIGDGWSIRGNNKAVYDLDVDSGALVNTSFLFRAGTTYLIPFLLDYMGVDCFADLRIGATKIAPNYVDLAGDAAGSHTVEITPDRDGYQTFIGGDGEYTISNVRAYKKGDGTAKIYTKKDTEKTWRLVGEASVEDADEPEIVIVNVPFNQRARTFYIKIETYGPLDFVGAVVQEIEMDGDR